MLNDLKELEDKLKKIIREKLADDELASIILYAMFPAGKLFRPNLALAMGQDAGKLGKNHYLLAAAVETHHAYSLIHDDLPCMDDDDERRGRPSTHKQFNEWKALLAGDAMISLSFELLADIKHERSTEIISDFARMMGPRGLILGQFIDLSHCGKSLDDTLKMHELKTARLIQFPLTASLALSDNKHISKSEIHELGKLMGINFQLLDDLGELVGEVDQHEDHVNAFLNYDSKKVLQIVLENNEKIFATLDGRDLAHLKNMYTLFLKKTLDRLDQGMDSVLQKTSLDRKAFLPFSKKTGIATS